MEYEVVELNQKQVVGLKIRTSNTAKDMSEKIGKTWTDFYSNGIYASITNKVNANTIGLYTNYESDFTGEYDMLACCEVSACEQLPDGVTAEVIPAGKYARFIIKGDVHNAVAEFWNELWNMDLDRAYTADFEEYQATSENMEHAEIHIYISLK
jgi:predicted transcriptional regulator YdeE